MGCGASTMAHDPPFSAIALSAIPDDDNIVAAAVDKPSVRYYSFHTGEEEVPRLIVVEQGPPIALPEEEKKHADNNKKTHRLSVVRMSHRNGSDKWLGDNYPLMNVLEVTERQSKDGRRRLRLTSTHAHLEVAEFALHNPKRCLTCLPFL